MRFYPQMLLWTYVLLPAVSLLLLPTFVIALARANQQRAKIMANAMTARGRAAAALARNQQRRYIPNNRFAKNYGQNRPYQPYLYRAKRQAETVLEDQFFSQLIDPMMENLKSRPPSSQIVALNDPNSETSADIQGSNNKLARENDGWNKATDSVNEPMIHQSFGQPDEPPPKFFKLNNPNVPEPHGIKGVSDIVPPIDAKHKDGEEFLKETHWDQQEESLSQLQNMWNMNNFGRSQPNEVMRRSTHFDMQPLELNEDTLGGPHLPGHKKHQSQNLDYYSGAFSGRNVFDDIVEQKGPFSNMEIIRNARDFEGSEMEPKSANPEPQPKKHKKKKKKKGGHRHRSSEFEEIPFMHVEEIDTSILDGPPSFNERYADPDPTVKLILLKKLLKKLDEQHDSHAMPLSYVPPPYYGAQHFSPYYRAAEMLDSSTEEEMVPIVMEPASEGFSEEFEQRSADPEPTVKIILLKKLLKKLDEQHIPYQYHPQSYGQYYSSYYRNADDEHLTSDGFLDRQITPTLMEPQITNDDQNQPPFEERSANPEPTVKLILLKKLLKKLDEQHIPYQHIPNYMPQHSYGGSHYSPYYRTMENLEEEMQPVQMEPEFDGDPTPFQDRAADPQPTIKIKLLKKLLKKLDDEEHAEHIPYPYPPSYMHYSYPGPQYSSYYRAADNPNLPFDEEEEPVITESEIDGDQIFDDMEHRSANPDPKKKKKKKGQHHRNSEADDDFMLDQQHFENGQRFADPQPTLLKKKLKKLMKKLDEDSHHSQFSGYPYSPYRSVELPDMQEFNGQQNLLGSEREPINSQSQHNPNKLDTQPKREKDFFYSSNFYEGKNKENLVQNKKAREKRNADLQKPPPKEEGINLGLKDKSKNSKNEENVDISTPQNDKGVQTSLTTKSTNPEDVSCQLDDNLFDRNSESYQRAVDELEEQNKRLVEATKKFLQPMKESLSEHSTFSPPTDEPKKDEFDNIDLDQLTEIINNNDQSNFDILSQTHDRLKQPAEVKSADANADAHHHHGSTHTHGHFKHHSHGNIHQNNLGPQQGIPVNPQIHISNQQHQQSFAGSGFQQSQFGHEFGSTGNIAHSGSQAFSDGGFGHSGSFKPNGGSMHQPQGFQNGQFNPIGNRGLNFANGWHDPRSLGFNSNNPGQFVNSFSGAQIVGQEHEDKTFVNPHLDKITSEEMHSEIDSDGNRFSRSQGNFQDVFKGLNLATSIVDASLDENRFTNRNIEEQLAHNPNKNSGNPQSTMDFVENIVDSGLEAGKIDREILQKQENLNSGFKADLPFLPNLLGTNLRNKRNDTHKEILLVNDTSPNKDTPLNGENFTNDEKTNNKEGIVLNETKTDNNVDNSVNTSIPDNSNTQKVFIIRNPNDSNIKESIIKHEEKVFNKNKSHFFNTDRSNQDDTVWIMLDPSAVASNPNILTDGSLPSTWGDKNKKVYYVIPNSKRAFINTKLENLPLINTKMDLDKNNFKNTKENDNKGIENQTKRVIPVTENKLVQNDDINDSSESTEKTTENSDEDSNESLIEKFEKENKGRFMFRPQNNQEAQELNQENATLGFAPEWNNTSLNSTDAKDLNLQSKTEKSESLSQENISLDSITPEVMPFLFHADGTRKNISELTSEEVEEIQFANIESKNGTKTEHSSYNTNNSNKLQDYSKNKKIEVTSSKIQNSFSSESEIKPISNSHSVNNVAPKMNLNFTGGPLSSMEDEMSVLTDEEKEEFIRQEMELIAEVIEETLKHKTLPGATLEVKNIKMNESNETKDKLNRETVVSQPNLFQSFYRESSREAYDRTATSENDIDSVLGQQRQKVEDIKQDASNGDDDLLMISFIGDSALNDLENRRQEENYQIKQTNDNNQLNHDNKKNNTNEYESNVTNPTDSVNNTRMLDTSNSSNNGTNTTQEILNNRTKRDISGLRTSRAPLTQLITDPTTKLDVKKTLQNLGNIARHTFENPKAPIYHMRNMLGNTKNSIMSAARIPPNNFLIPSQYEINKISKNKDENAEKVGAVNQNMILSRSGFGDNDTEEKPETPGNGDGSIGFEDTFNKFGGIIRDSINTGKDTVSHVNDAATNARNAYYTTRQNAPRIVLPHQRPALSSRSSYFPLVDSPLLGSIQKKNRKTVLITPKIFDLQENMVGATAEDPDNFIGMRNLLDSAGISKPNQKEIGMQKIVFEPYKFKKNMFIPKKENSYVMSRSGINTNALDEINTSDSIVGSEHSDEDFDSGNLQNDDYGMDNLRKFMLKMHDEMKEMLRNQYEDRKKKRMQKYEEVKMNQYYKAKKESKYPRKASMQTLQKPVQKYRKKDYSNQYYNEEENIDENVEMTIPPEIFQKYAKISKLQGYNQNSVKDDNNNKQQMQTVKINARLQDIPSDPQHEPVNFNPSLPKKYTHQDKIQEKSTSNTNNDEEKVSLFLPSELMKPFMGQASENLLHEYMRENGDEDVFERESSDNLKNRQGSDLSHKMSSIPIKYTTSPILPKVPKPLGLNIPTIKPLLTPNLTPILSNPGVVGAAEPQNNAANADLSNITKEKKEFVELLSKPEIEDTNLPEQHQRNTKQKSFVTPGPVVNNTPIKKTPQGIMEHRSTNENENTNVETFNNKHMHNNNNQPSSVFFKNVPLRVADIPNEDDLGYVLGAINPMMFERYFNERLKLNNTGLTNTQMAHTENTNDSIVVGSPQPTESGKIPINEEANKNIQGRNQNKNSQQLEKELKQLNQDSQQVTIQTNQNTDQKQVNSDKSDSDSRTSMHVFDTYKKPFMGQISKDKVHDFLKQYNNDLNEDNEHKQEEMENIPQENYQSHNNEPIKNVVFLNYDEDENYAY